MAKVTIQDVARVAGVSVATVDRVLNRRPGVRSVTVNRVESDIRDLNYQPDRIAAREVLRPRRIPGPILADDAADIADTFVKRCVLRRVDDVDPTGENGDSAGCETSLVRRRIDSASHSRNDQQSGRTKLRRDFACERHPVRRRLA